MALRDLLWDQLCDGRCNRLDIYEVPMNILALDMATVTGWATPHASGVWDLSIRSDESSGMRLIRFEAKLRETIKACEIGLIVFEGVILAHGARLNITSIKLASKLQGIVEYLVESTDGLECCSYNNMTIKKHAIPGKGKKRDKEAMLRAARERWPDEDIADHNQADARFLLDLAEKELGL